MPLAPNIIDHSKLHIMSIKIEATTGAALEAEAEAAAWLAS